jgi:hypothetical protein
MPATALFAACLLIVLHARGEGDGSGEQLGSVQGRQGAAGATVRRGQSQDTPSANELERTKERREYPRSASVYVFVCGAQGEHEW